MTAFGPLQAATEEQVNDAIDRGMEYLLRAVEENQSTEYGNGLIALETYALVVAGISVQHPLIQRNFDTLKKDPLMRTYWVSCYCFALDAAISQLHDDLQFLKGRMIPDGPRIGREFRTQLERAILALVRIKQEGSGSWDYTRWRRGGDGGTRYDNSNTQFAVLALGVGAKRRIAIAQKVWEEIAEHFIENQEKNGPPVKERVDFLPEDKRRRDFGAEHEVLARGWSYRGSERSATWNMTCAGLSSVLVAAENLKDTASTDLQKRIGSALRDGFGWLLKKWDLKKLKGQWKYYGLYSLEKVADLADVKRFGSHDWYQEVTDVVVSEQEPDGGWPGSDAKLVRTNTAFALLVLNRATTLLTRRAHRMVLSGPGASRAPRDVDKWVYIKSLDRELHLPSVFRMARLRPNPQALRFIELMVEHYPVERNGLLIPYLVELHQRLGTSGAKKLVVDNMQRITGTEYEDVDRYMDWYQQWREVERIGTLAEKEEAPYLLDCYRNGPDGLRLRQKVIWALGRCRSKEAAPLLIEDLKHADLYIRTAAYAALTTLPLGIPPPRFDPAAKPKVRQEQVRAVAKWYQELEE